MLAAQDRQVKIPVTLDTQEFEQQLGDLKQKIEAFAQSMSHLMTFKMPMPEMAHMPKGGASGSGGGASGPTFLGQAGSGGGGATTMATPAVNFIPMWQPSGMDARYKQAMELAARINPVPQTSTNRNLNREEIDLVDSVKKLSTMMANAASQIRAGGSVRGSRTEYLQQQMQYMSQQYQQSFANANQKFSPEAILSRTERLAEEQRIFQSHSAGWQKNNQNVGSRIERDAKNIQADVRAAESIAQGNNYLTQMSQHWDYINQNNPSASSSWWHRAQTGHQVLSHFMPMIGALATGQLFAQTYQLGGQLANSAGEIGMQAGGANPSSVYNHLLSAGNRLGFSATQTAQAAQLQGQFAGTSNVAFLFKDAMATAQFARYLGIGNQQAAQVLGGYQLVGAFSAGNEASTAQSITAAASASGVNSQQYMSGLQQLTSSAMRTSTWTGGNGPAQSLAVAMKLGSSLGIPLFTGSQAVGSLEAIQQGFQAGPGQGSGATAAVMMPAYQAALKVMAPEFKKIGITNPYLQMASMMQTPIYSNQKELGAYLGAYHDILASAKGATQETLKFQVAHALFGNTSYSSLQAVTKLAGSHFSSSLSQIEKQVNNAKSSGSEPNRQSTYLQSIAQSTQKIDQDLQRIIGTGAQAMLPAGAAVTKLLGNAPGATYAGGAALSVGTAFSPLISGVVGGAVGASILKKIGGGGSSILSRFGNLFKGGVTDAAGASAADVGAGVGTDAALGGIEAVGAGFDATGVGLPVGLSIGLIGGIAALASMASHGKGNAMLSSIMKYAKAARANPLLNHPLLKSGVVNYDPLAPHQGAASTLSKIAEVGQSPGFQNFVSAFTNPSATNAKALIGSGIGSMGIGLNTSVMRDIQGQATYTSPGGGSVTYGPSSVMGYHSLINKTGNKYSVPANVLAGIMSQESSGNPYSIYNDSTNQSYSNLTKSQYLSLAHKFIANGNSIDMGLMQINSAAHPNVTPAEAANPTYALSFAARLLQSDRKRMGNWTGAIRAYNAGVGGAQSGGGYTYLHDVENKMSAFGTSKDRPSVRHNLNHKRKKANQK